MAASTMAGAIRERVRAGDSAYVSLGTGLKVHKVAGGGRTVCGLDTRTADSLWHVFRASHPGFCRHCRRILEAATGADHVRGDELEAIELGHRVHSHYRGTCWYCWRRLPASGLCVAGCRNMREGVRI